MKYVLIPSSIKDVDTLKDFKLHSIIDYADNLSNDEMNKINHYLDVNIPKEIDAYQNVVIDHHIVGCLGVIKHDDGVLLDEIYLKEEYRGKGIGTELIKSVIHNYPIVYLWVYKNNDKALSLYHQLGFNIVNETDTRYYMKYSQ